MIGTFSIPGALWKVAPICLLAMSGNLAREAPDLNLHSEFTSSSLKQVEYFVIANQAGPAGPNEGDVVGLVEWRERVMEGGRVLERDVFFAEGQLTVRHVERLTRDTRRLVWREAAQAVGRSQIVEPEGESLVVVDWLRSGLQRTELEHATETRFPLELLEALREGRRLPPKVQRYWPLTRSVEELRIELHNVDGTPGIRRRLVELWRVDGSLAGRYLFDGEVLEAFQWQAGGPWARSISAQRHRSLRAQLARKRVVEAAASPR